MMKEAGTERKVVIEEKEEDGRKTLQYKFNESALRTWFHGQDPYADDLSSKMSNFTLNDDRRDILTALCVNIELAVQIGKHLRPEDIVNLFIASRAFNKAISGYLLSSVRIWIQDRCPEAGHIFPFTLYKKHLICDPNGRTWGDIYEERPKGLSPERMQQIRTIPGLRYMQLVLNRDRYCREIIAIMARNGHLMPKSMYSTLLRLWLIMELPKTEQRKALLRNKKMWRDQDLYNAQLFFIKLGMHFNDPIYGPCTYELVHLMMGQRGLYPLWQLLMRKKFTTLAEFIELKVRYDVQIRPEHWGFDLFARGFHRVPFYEVGIGHWEVWGKTGSRRHLGRPDELIPVEAVQRGLQLDDHIRHMILWGYFDWTTGENLVPTEEDMYISDEERALGHADTMHHWKKKHALKKRWDRLTPEEQRAIQEDDEDEKLRALAWCGEEEDDTYEYYSDSDDGEYNLDDEITRGYLMPSQPANHQSTVPALDDKQGWAEFVNDSLIGMPYKVDEDEALRAQIFHQYDSDVSDDSTSWSVWLARNGAEMRELMDDDGRKEHRSELDSAWEADEEEEELQEGGKDGSTEQEDLDMGGT